MCESLLCLGMGLEGLPHFGLGECCSLVVVLSSSAFLPVPLSSGEDGMESWKIN